MPLADEQQQQQQPQQQQQQQRAQPQKRQRRTREDGEEEDGAGGGRGGGDGGGGESLEEAESQRRAREEEEEEWREETESQQHSTEGTEEESPDLSIAQVRAPQCVQRTPTDCASSVADRPALCLAVQVPASASDVRKAALLSHNQQQRHGSFGCGSCSGFGLGSESGSGSGWLPPLASAAARIDRSVSNSAAAVPSGWTSEQAAAASTQAIAQQSRGRGGPDPARFACQVHKQHDICGGHCHVSLPQCFSD